MFTHSRFALALLLLAAVAANHLHAAVPFDASGVRPGPVTVTSTAQAATVHWSDEANRPWTAEFSLDPKTPYAVLQKADRLVL